MAERPARILGDVRRHIDLAQLHHEVLGVEALVAAERDRARSIGAGLDHVERGQPFGMTGDARQARVDEDAVPVLHQGMADVAELGFHARSLAIQQARPDRSSRRASRSSASRPEVDLGIAPAARRRLAAAIALGLEALQARPGFHQRAVDREVIRGQQALDLRLRQDGSEELPAISPSSSRSRFFENTE